MVLRGHPAPNHPGGYGALRTPHPPGPSATAARAPGRPARRPVSRRAFPTGFPTGCHRVRVDVRQWTRSHPVDQEQQLPGPPPLGPFDRPPGLARPARPPAASPPHRCERRPAPPSPEPARARVRSRGSSSTDPRVRRPGGGASGSTAPASWQRSARPATGARPRQRGDHPRPGARGARGGGCRPARCRAAERAHEVPGRGPAGPRGEGPGQGRHGGLGVPARRAAQAPRRHRDDPGQDRHPRHHAPAPAGRGRRGRRRRGGPAS
jgi:hypothetical protein